MKAKIAMDMGTGGTWIDQLSEWSREHQEELVRTASECAYTLAGMPPSPIKTEAEDDLNEVIEYMREEFKNSDNPADASALALLEEYLSKGAYAASAIIGTADKMMAKGINADNVLPAVLLVVVMTIVAEEEGI
jgi:hypothetical protein